MKRRSTDKQLAHDAATALARLYERNSAGAGEVALEMPHWEFNLNSPLPGDPRHFGVIDFRLERLELTERTRLTLSFFTTGVVGYSKTGNGWLFFSSGAKGQPELAEATPEQIERLPSLPGDWEAALVEVDL